jgi:hypothetical protein
MRGLIKGLLPLCLMALAVGCVDKNALKPLNLSVQPDVESLKAPSGQTPELVVDIVGVQVGDELKRYEAKPVDQWIQPNDDLKAASKRYKMVFPPGQYTTQVLLKNDPIWKEWDVRQVKFLAIFANYARPSGSAEPDPRRLILPVTVGCWQDVPLKDEAVRIELRRSGMTAVPPPGPEKP